MSKTIEHVLHVLIVQNLKIGLPPELAETSARDAVDMLCRELNGDRVYFPAPSAERRDRDERLFAAIEYGGVPVPVAAERMGVSERSARRIVKRHRQRLQSLSTDENRKKCA